ncbi:MAG: tetratricopeptide repeat protein [Desulfobacteraceae bacterium]
MSFYEEARQVGGGDYKTYLRMGDMIHAENNPALLPISLACYVKSLELRPDNPMVYCRMGILYKQLGQPRKAIAVLEKALELDTAFIPARFNLLNVLCPVLYEKEEEIMEARAAYEKELHALCGTLRLDNEAEIKRAAQAVGRYPFHLAYQGYNDVEFQRRYGELVCRIQTARYPQWSGKKDMPPHNTGEPLRIGIVSGFFHDHSNWKMRIHGWLDAMDRSRFALYGYYTGKGNDDCTAFARRSFNRFVEKEHSLTNLCQTIAADRLHVLIYPEIGMKALTLRLAALRLAPVQCTTWGHPTTSGLPTIDYYLSSDLMEPPDGQNAYTETLIRLPNLSVYYPPLEHKSAPLTREELGLSADRIIFLCPQSLYKYLPQHDDLFPRIAQAVGACTFLFCTGDLSQPLVNQFRRRLAGAFDRYGLKSDDFILLKPMMDTPTYQALNGLADIFLDSLEWSGCNTTMEAIACDLPVVTLPGRLMRGRHSMAILAMMGMSETIADTKKHYVELAVRLATDSAWRAHIRKFMTANKHKLYRDKQSIRSLEAFLENAVACHPLSRNRISL